MCLFPMQYVLYIISSGIQASRPDSPIIEEPLVTIMPVMPPRRREETYVQLLVQPSTRLYCHLWHVFALVLGPKITLA